MKKVNFLKAVLFVVLFTSFTATTFSDPVKTKAPVKQKSIQNDNFDMKLSNTNTDLIVMYLNPESQHLMVTVYDIFGNPLETAMVNDAEGKVIFNLATLEAKGGTGTYTVAMTDGEGGNAKKSTIVIIKF
jgi:hypothetical protein